MLLAAALLISAVPPATARTLALANPADALTAMRKVQRSMKDGEVVVNARTVALVRFFDSTNHSVSSPPVLGADRREFGATLGYRF